MTERKARTEFTIKRIKGFFKGLVRSKRGLFGIVILVVAIAVAIGAPLMTPYDPINSRTLAGTLSQPSWARYLPGGGGLSENMIPVDESAQLQSPNALNEFNVTVTPSSSQNVAVQHSAFGINPNSSGSLAVTYQSAGLPNNSSLTVRITRDFYYPYSGTPGEMIVSASILMSRIEGAAVSPRLFLQQNWPSYVSPNVYSDNATRFPWWINPKPPANPIPVTFTQDNATLSWQSFQGLQPLQSSGMGTLLLKQLFPRAGSYSFGIEMTLTKLAPKGEAVIYLDNLKLTLLGSSWGLLGTDAEGRDVFTQLVYGTRISLYVGLVASVIGVVLGLLVGLVSAYVGGVVDEILMRFTDALLVLPGLPLMIVLITILSAGEYNLNIFILVIGFLGWMGFARVVRSQVLSLKERPYVEAAKAVGAGTPYILFRHILPNVVTLIYVTLALSVPSAIVSEAAFSFLGFVDFTQMSWGRMLNGVIGKPEIWWLVIPPGLAIAVLSLSFILLGYAMDEILNPKLRMRR